jgi:hypothetical protein
MKVKVKPTAGGGAAALLEVELEGGEATTVADAKRAIAALMPEMGPDPRLIYRGQILKDERTVGSYGEGGSSGVSEPRESGRAAVSEGREERGERGRNASPPE